MRPPYQSMLKIISVNKNQIDCYVMISGDLTKRKAKLERTANGINVKINDCLYALIHTTCVFKIQKLLVGDYIPYTLQR